MFPETATNIKKTTYPHCENALDQDTPLPIQQPKSTMGKRATQVEIAKRLSLDVSTVNKILHAVPGPKWREETVKAVFDTAHKIGYDLGQMKHRHSRSHPRISLDLTVKVSIELFNKEVVDKGTAQITSISLGGARLSHLQLGKDSIPIEPFYIQIRFKNVALKEPLRAEIVRIIAKDRLEFGVRFRNIDMHMAKALRKVIGW